MSRKMKKIDSDITLEVGAWAMLKNTWEYFIEQPKKGEKPDFALVEGFESELGYFSMDEIKPHVWAFAANEKLNDLQPAVGWEWVD